LRAIGCAGLLIPLVLAAGAVSGCAGDVVDPKKTQIALRFDIAEQTGTRIAKVDCPSGVEVIPGARFSCTVTARDGTEAIAIMEILNQAADLKVLRLTNP
jgi:hypothetical protein